MTDPGRNETALFGKPAPSYRTRFRVIGMLSVVHPTESLSAHESDYLGSPDEASYHVSLMTVPLEHRL